MLKITVDMGKDGNEEINAQTDFRGMSHHQISGDFSIAYHLLVETFAHSIGVDYDAGQIALMTLAAETDRAFKATIGANLIDAIVDSDED